MDYRCCKIYDPEALNITSGIHMAEIMTAGYFKEPFPKSDETRILSDLKELTISDSLVCSYCRKSFADSLEQRNHYKLDWHRYNVKRALSGSVPVSEENFLSHEGDVTSISGSETNLSSDESNSDGESEEKNMNFQNSQQSTKVQRHIKVFFENDRKEVFSLYKCLLQGKKENLVEETLMNSALDVIRKPQKWMIVILGGGHFAAGIFDGENITHHKTLHYYTVRAKQGGSQSTRDKQGGNHPKSAGANLRRHNEQVLVQQIQETISSWSEPIEQCNLILYRAPGPHNRSTLFGGRKAPFNKTDKRLRNISFPTRRPTLKEVKRVHDTLSNIEVYGSADEFKTKFPRTPSNRIEDDGKEKLLKKIKKAKREISGLGSHTDDVSGKAEAKRMEEIEAKIESDEEEKEEIDFDLVWNDSLIDFNDLREFDDTISRSSMGVRNTEKARKEQEQKNRKKIRGKKNNKSRLKTIKEREFTRVREKLLDCCKIGNESAFIEALNAFNEFPSDNKECDIPSNIFTKQDLIDCLNSPIEEENGNTLLHICAFECLSECVKNLLLAGADPTIRNKSGKTSYTLAGNKKTKNSFREFVSSYPEKFDLKKANIPAPLTEEEERERDERKKEKRKAKNAKEKEKKREKEEKLKFLALSDREKCALAAERRLLASITSNVKSVKAPVLSRCFQCGLDITGKIPFEYGNNRFCSVPCLKAHRAKTKTT